MANKQIKKYHHRSFTFSPEDIDLASEFIGEILDAFGTGNLVRPCWKIWVSHRPDNIEMAATSFPVL